MNNFLVKVSHKPLKSNKPLFIIMICDLPANKRSMAKLTALKRRDSTECTP